MQELSITALALYAIVIAFAGFVHGTIGMGFPVVSTPLLSLFVDVRTAILLTLVPTVTVNLASLLRGGSLDESVGRHWPLAVYALGGSVVGARLLVTEDPAPFKLLLAGLVLLYLLVSSARGASMAWVGRYPRSAAAGFGIAAGLAAGTTNVMVPLLIIWALELGLARRAMVQVFNLCFLAGKVSQIAVFAAAGLLTGSVLLATLPLAVVAAAALAAGMQLQDRIPAAAYRKAIKLLLLVLALLLIGQYVAWER